MLLAGRRKKKPWAGRQKNIPALSCVYLFYEAKIMTSPFTQSPNVFKHERTHAIGACGYRQRTGFLQDKIWKPNDQPPDVQSLLTRQRCTSDGLQALPRVSCTPSLLGVLLDGDEFIQQFTDETLSKMDDMLNESHCLESGSPSVCRGLPRNEAESQKCALFIRRKVFFSF